MTSQKLVEPPVSIKISIDQKGVYLLNQTPIDLDELQLKLQAEKQRHPQSIVLLYADQNARYENIAKVLGTIHHSGISKVGFVTEDAAQN
jgi:biopolymer transport protein ExbD